MDDNEKFHLVDMANRILDEQQRMRELLSPSLDRLAQLGQFEQLIQSLQLQWDLIEQMESQSPMLQLADSTNLVLARMMESDNLNRIVEEIETTRRFEDQTEKLLEPMGSSTAISDLFQSHIARITQVSLVAEVNLVQVPWDSVGQAIQIDRERQVFLQEKIFEFSNSYMAFYRSLEEHPEYLASLPLPITRLPSVEHLLNVRMVRSISPSPREEPEPSEEAENIRKEVSAETESSLEELLGELDGDLLALLRGAKEAARSKNPDRARHVSTSLRELYTHIVHRIAPDSEVQSWTSESSHFHDGRPTRKARLLYVCRHLNHGPFETFVQKDVAAALGFLDLFQVGTHSIAPDFSITQLSSLIRRMEGLLRFLLETSKAEKGVDIEPTPKGASFLRTARSLNLDGPPDWAANIDRYLYGGESSDED